MQTFLGRTFVGEVVLMDDVHFCDCTLVDCTLKYSGRPVVLERTHLKGCSYLFFGSAKASIEFLQCVGLMPEMDARWFEVAEPVELSAQVN